MSHRGSCSRQDGIPTLLSYSLRGKGGRAPLGPARGDGPVQCLQGCCAILGCCIPTSRGACTSMNSSKMRWALEASLAAERVFLKSSQASQNSRFSSLNSVFRKARKAASPSAGETQREEKEGREVVLSQTRFHPPLPTKDHLIFLTRSAIPGRVHNLYDWALMSCQKAKHHLM